MQSLSKLDVPRAPRALFWVGLAMCVMCLAAIGAAETFMPENLAGQRAVVTMYRWFGASLVCWGAVVTWSVTRRRTPFDHLT